MALITTDVPDFLARPGRFYQGCGDIIKGTRLDKVAFLNKVEVSAKQRTTNGVSRLTHIIEPKSDGTWVAVVSNDFGDVYLLTKTGSQKKMQDIGDIKLLPDTIVVGELAGGSQQSAEDMKKHGHRFVKVFDVLKIEGNDVTPLTLLKRKAILNKVFAKMGEKGGVWANGLKHILLMPMWSNRLVSRYNNEPEGLIAKVIDDGPYVCGSRNKGWIKVKKTFSSPYVIVGWVKSKAATKLGRSVHGMCEHLVLAGWVPDDKVTVFDKTHGCTKIEGMPCTLIELLQCGSMTDNMALDVAANFEGWRGLVVKIGHYKLFKSGGCRHPFLYSDENGFGMIEECHHTKCLYRLGSQEALEF